MTYPRQKIINLEQTPYYHCVSRCVRRSFLCGSDRYTGRSYEHRRAWVEERLLQLSDAFTIDVFAYAVMHNHTHLVLYVDQKKNAELSDLEVIQRWSRLSKLDDICHSFMQKRNRYDLSEFENHYLDKKISLLKERLCSISWFMSMLNHYIACKANKEDECTGRFWEGRFKSQALLTEKALLACMAYVDLNPIRAGVSNCLLNSDYTSIKRRLKTAKSLASERLLPLGQLSYLSSEETISQISLRCYIKHLNMLCKQDQQRIAHIVNLGSVELDSQWLSRSHDFEKAFTYMAGAKEDIIQFRRQVRSGMANHLTPINT